MKFMLYPRCVGKSQFARRMFEAAKKAGLRTILVTRNGVEHSHPPTRKGASRE